MKNLRFGMAALAVIFGLGTAVATSHHHLSGNKKWGRDPMTGLYTDVTGQQKGADYLCNSSSINCTEEYTPDVDPNDQANDSHPGIESPQAVELGSFSQ